MQLHANRFLAVVLFFSGVSALAQCASEAGSETLAISFESTYLRRELSGFFAYQNTGSEPPAKFKTESWTGAEHIVYPGGGCHVEEKRDAFTGSWTFSSEDFTSSSNKSITGDAYVCSVGWAPFARENLHAGMNLYSDNWRSNYSVTSPTAHQRVGSTANNGINSYAVSANVIETLSAPFLVEDAIARADLPENIRPEDVAADSLQYWDDYFPATWAQAQTLARTAPVTFHARRVGFRLELPAKPCGGKFQLILKFKEGSLGEPEAALPTRTVVFPEWLELDKKDVAHWPSPTTYKTYEELGVELKQGFMARLVSAELRPAGACDSLPAGDAIIGLGSVDFSLSLGRVDADAFAGVISLLAPSITPSLFTPAALQITAAPSVVVLRDATNAIRQVIAPEIVVDIITLSPDSYELRSYLPSQAGAPDPGSGLRPFTGDPRQTYAFTSDASGPEPSLTITPGNTPSRAATYIQNGSSSMSMMQAAADRMETVSMVVAGSVATETRIIADAAGAVVSRQSTQYVTYAFGSVITSRTLGEGVDAQTTGTVYHTNAADSANYGRIQQVTEPSGAWTRYTYDEQGRVLTETRRHLNNTGTAAASHHLTTTTYGTLADQDGDSLPEALVTRIEKTLNIETARSYEIAFTATEAYNGLPTERTHFIRAATPGAAWDASGNLVTVSRTIASGAYADKSAASLSSDGSLTTYAYATDSGTGALTTTIDSGAANTGLTGVIAGTRSITVTDAFGRTIERTTIDIATATLLDSYVVTESDHTGRPLRIDYADGTFELRSYACCGLASETDRQGVTNNYDYDALGRLESTSRPGSTTRHTYDAAGNRLKTIRIGADDSEITVMENAYDTAGRIKSAKDALLRPTAYVFENLGVGGTWTVVTTPGGGTRIETTAADGTLLKVEGNATPWRAYAYAIHPDGSRSTTEYTPATSITDTTAWRRTTVDFLGRPVSETTADGATSTYHYDAVGRLIRTVDPDGVQTLYAYDAEGRRTVTALDVNRNGVIDYSGPDRISRTVATYATRSGVPVSRTTTETWEADGSDAPTLVSETDTTLDGRETWQTVRGLTTHALTTFTPDGDFSTVTTTPDGTLQEQDYIDGRLDSFVVSHPSLGVLGSASYSYDPHGRLASVTSPAGVTSYTYAQDGQVLTITTPDPDSTRSGPGYDPQVTAYRYDTAGRVDRVTGSDGAQTFTEYFPSGQVKKTWGARVYPQAYAYDAQRRVRTLTTWQDHAAQTGAAVTTWNYDTQTGRLLNKRDADGQGASYTYTLAGRLATRTWARTSSLPAPGSPLITTYGYTDAGDLGSVTYSDATPGVAHTHDRLGRAKTTTDAAGLLTRTYANGQLTNEVYTGTGLLSGQSLTRGFDALRRLQTLSVPSVYSVSYGYDDASRLSTITEGTRVATQGYHATQGYPETIAIANSSVPRLTATRALDNLGRVASVTAPSVASVAYDYNAANQRIRATREDASYWDYEYDTLGQVISAVKRHADTTPRPGHHFGYAFDDIGNRTETTFNNLASIYAPDLKNQYLSRTTPAAIPVLGTADPAALVRANGEDVANRSGAWFYHELTLDGSGEPEYFQFPVSATTLQGDPPTSELVSSETKNAFVPASPEQFAHDADGNLTQDGRWDYVWDAENRLVAMQTKLAIATAFPELKQRLEFAYDAQGRRIAKRVLIWNSSTSTFSLNSETAFLYDGWNLVAELDCSTLPAPGSLLRSYAWGLDLSGSTQGAGGVGGLLWANVAPGSSPLAPGSFAPTYDGNGNIIAWVDLTTGSKVAENDYTAFGELIAISGTNPVPFGFSTKYLDSETGLNYYGFRYYNPSTGRWPSRDPSGERGGLNLYGMVDNNLINFIDVLGLFKASPEEMAKIFEQGYKGSREAYLLTRDHPERIEYGGLICKSAATGDIYRTKPVAGLNQQQVEEKFGPDSGVGGSVNPYLSPCKPCDIVVGIYHSHPEGAYLSGYRGDINLADEKNIPMFAGTAPWGLTIDKTHFGMASYVPDGSFDINKEWDPEAGNGGRGKHEFYNPIPIEGPSPYLPDSKFVNQHSRLE